MNANERRESPSDVHGDVFAIALFLPTEFEVDMNWKRTWRNQYGSTLAIADDTDHRILGLFRTVLEDSGFYGQEIAVIGVHQGDCISFAGGGNTSSGDAIVSYSGLWREDKMEGFGSWSPTPPSSRKPQAVLPRSESRNGGTRCRRVGTRLKESADRGVARVNPCGNLQSRRLRASAVEVERLSCSRPEGRPRRSRSAPSRGIVCATVPSDDP